MGLMSGKVGLVTAAGDGIGRASARAFAAEGAIVVVSDIVEASGRETVRLIEEVGGTASFVAADAADEEQVAALVAETVTRHGRLDWAHNNAAVNLSVGPITTQQRSRWDRTLAVTLTGTMLCLKHEITQMLAQGHGGAIVNTASSAGLTGMENLSAYVAAKWGVIGLTKSAALENAAAGIRVNAICPGMTGTAGIKGWFGRDPEAAAAMQARVPFGRLAEPEEQAQAALWLCCDRSGFVTGVALPVDGGLTSS